MLNIKLVRLIVVVNTELFLGLDSATVVVNTELFLGLDSVIVVLNTELMINHCVVVFV